MSNLVPFHNIYRSTAANPDDAPALVLLHGWGLHSIVWDDVMPALLQHFQVTVIDLPGMGQSPLPAGDYTLELILEQISPILPARFHLLGWSLGGLVATALAARMPERVQSLVLVTCNPKFVRGDDWPAAMDAQIFDKFLELYEEDAEGTLIRFLALNCKDADTMRDDVRKLREVLFFCGLPARKALRGGLEILRDTDTRAWLGQLSCPVLALFGEKDNLVPVAVADEVSKLPVQIAIQEGVSHVPFISAPDIFIQALTDFWRQHGLIVEAASA